jgi:hypothetical protein
MTVYLIYKKSQYEKLNTAKKIKFILSGKSRFDVISAFTKHKNVAKAYTDVNPNTYIKKCLLTDDTYKALLDKYGDKEIQCFSISSTNQLVLYTKKYKSEMIKKGIEFHDYSQ